MSFCSSVKRDQLTSLSINVQSIAYRSDATRRLAKRDKSATPRQCLPE